MLDVLGADLESLADDGDRHDTLHGKRLQQQGLLRKAL